MQKDINTRKGGHATDMQPGEEVVQTYNFPSLGVSVEAKTMDEALEKAKAMFKKDNK
ncbi:hypothetical protein [Novosphingobium aquae]|uniref:Uncharacterized protein n=1 Tax=Novosphingobium aquae TaxID=3133435 RepID=A0ABU8SC18_9SPHN